MTKEIKIYRTETQADYNALMSYFEDKGYKWLDGSLPTQGNYFNRYEDTYYYLEGGVISLSEKEYYKRLYRGGLYRGVPIIEYKGGKL